MKILYTTLFTLIISAGLCQGQSLKINEIMNWNTSTLKDGSGNYNPWVELYNSGPSPIDLQGYFLADHEYLLKRWEFPSVSIAAGDYLIVFLSGKEKGVAGEIHSDIKITSSWQGIYLSDPSGQLIDKCRYQSMGLDISYGRSTDGGSAFAFFNQPTPGASNNTTPYASAAEAPIFSHRAGFYQNAFRLSISNPDPSAEVRYTLDGSDPTSSSPLYTGPIQISSRASDPNTISMIQSSFNSYWLPPSGNVEKYSIVKARIFKAGHIDGEIATSTYFIDSNIKNRFNMPVVSLSTDPANFFDYTKGIYVPGKTFDDALAANPSMPIGETTPANFTMKGDDWARPCYIEYFESSGLGGFAQAASVDIHGAFSRLYRQHALNVKAGKGFDDPKSIDYPVFPGLVQTSGITKSKSKYLVSKDITKFKTLMLRNNGSDWGYTMFRDALAGSLFAHRNLSVQAYRPCVVYLNGEYWGIHDLREKFDQDYLEAHYGIPKTNSLILYNEGATYQGDSLLADDYTDMVSFISSNDMSVSSNYEYAKTKMDVENYAEFYAAEIFLNNTDWPGSNIRYWKTTNPYNPNAEYGQDGRWRWGLQDLDLTMGSDQPTGDYTYNALQKATMAGGTVWPNPDWSTTILRNLLRNPDFKNMFINTMADHMNSAVKTSRAISVIDRFTANIAAEMPAHISRWNAPYDMGFWNDQIDTLKQFAINRPRFQKTHIMQHFGITDTVHVTLHVSNTAQGKIRINTMDVDRDLPGVSAGVYPWTGTYFQNVPVSLHAIAYPGYRFVRWEGTVNSTDPVITLLNSGDEQVTAVFETASPFEPDKENVSLYPNPVSGTLNIEFTDDDNGDIYLFVYDRLGKQLYAAGVNKLTQTAIAHIDVSDFSKGLYILHVKSAKGTIYKKRFSVED